MKVKVLLFLLLAAWVLPVQAQPDATAECYMIDDISMAADDVIMQVDDLPDFLDEVMGVDEWDDDEGTRANGLRDAVTAARTEWKKMHTNVLKLNKEWKRMAPLATAGCSFSKKYKKAGKQLTRAEASAVEGMMQLKAPLQNLSIKDRRKAMFKAKGLQEQCQKALNSFSIKSSTLSDACETCHPDPDDFQ